MGINYIKQNLNKFDNDNLINFIFDIITCGTLDSIEDFDETKVYNINQKVYYKDVNNVHHIFKCKVDESTPGIIVFNEWEDLIQSFRKTIISEESVLTSLEAREEVILATEVNQTLFNLQVDVTELMNSYVIVFHPDLGRLSIQDFQITGNTIILKSEFAVANIGDRLIVDIYTN